MNEWMRELYNNLKLNRSLLDCSMQFVFPQIVYQLGFFFVFYSIAI